MTATAELHRSIALGVRARGTSVVVALFLAVRRLLVDQRFSTLTFRASYQLLDIRELRAHQFQSAALLHIQRPLFNVLVDTVLRA